MSNSSTALRLSVGAVLDAQTWPTLSGVPVLVPHADGVTHIQFRRFAGCPICNLHLRTFIARRSELNEAGVSEVIVFHSTVEELAKYESDLPFDVVPDRRKDLYREFGVEEGKRALLHPKVWWPFLHAIGRSAWSLVRHPGTPIPRLQPPGGRWGLPADVLVGRDGRVLAVHYGAHASDQWSVDEVLRLAKPSEGGSRR